jgi:hypothetical protein
MTTEERIAAIRADLNAASGVARNGERIRSAHAHLDAIHARLRSLTEAAQVAADALGKFDGKAERVFTHSEVRAIVCEMVEGVTAGEELTLETIAAKHGVVLDPA